MTGPKLWLDKSRFLQSRVGIDMSVHSMPEVTRRIKDVWP